MTIAIDMFAGWGGFTEGATRAGANVVWAANHWDLAVEAHAANHPGAVHVCQDLNQADWSTVPDFDLLLASPACQGHSMASQPRRRAHHDALRATAWAVIDCADAHEPETIIVENVPAFARWRLFPAWREALVAMGYRIDELVINAALHGVPQRRNRLFVVASRRRLDLGGLVEGSGQETPFGPCLDLDDPAPWRPVVEAPPRVRERVAKGRRSHGDRFLTQHVTNHPGVPLDEPIRTITTGDQWAIVDGPMYRPLTVRECARGMGFPDSYKWPEHATRKDKIRGLGNAVPPAMAQALVERVAA